MWNEASVIEDPVPIEARSGVSDGLVVEGWLGGVSTDNWNPSRQCGRAMFLENRFQDATLFCDNLFDRPG